MPTAIVEFAKAKVNVALHVLGRRPDGYHELDSIVGFADVADVLRVERAGTTTLRVSGRFAAAVPVDGSNLILKAHDLLGAVLELPPVRMDLEKNIPIAAGLGGGSADAAAALRAFSRLAKNPASDQALQAVALKLGADVPVCLRQTTRRMRGVGERLSDVAAVPVPAIVLVNPGVACTTAAVFARLNLAAGAPHLAALDPAQPETWRNDLTDAAIAVQPVIAEVLAVLSSYRQFSACRMSGSGATCFGLARSMADAETVAMALRASHPQWWVFAAALS